MRADGVPLNALDAVPTFWDGEQVTSTLDASVGAKRQTMPDKDRFMAALVPADPVAGTLSASDARSRGAGQSPAMLVPWEPEPPVSDPITANEGSTYTHEGSRNFRLHNVVGQAVDLRNGAVTEASQTLQSGGMGEDRGLCPNAIPHTAIAFKASHFTRGKDGAPTEVFPPLTADADKGDQDPVVLTPSPVVLLVRRLMPVECELLQGFPAGYTAVPFRGNLAADGPRYRALGNSWAVNCPRWIGRRIMAVEGIVDA